MVEFISLLEPMKLFCILAFLVWGGVIIGFIAACLQNKLLVALAVLMVMGYGFVSLTYLFSHYPSLPRP